MKLINWFRDLLFNAIGYKRFHRVYLGQKFYNYVTMYRFSIRVNAEHQAWFEGNISGRFRFDQMERSIYFSREQDAAIFKLCFC